MNLQTVELLAKQILLQEPGPVVRYRLLRDVLRLSINDRELLNAKKALAESKMIKKLDDEQWDDGSWGRLHSADTKLRQQISTTEIGVRRAIVLGLNKQDSVCKKAAEFLIRVLQGEQKILDPAELNDRWPVGETLFLASTLSLLLPEHPLVNKIRSIWQEILVRTFCSGHYDSLAEVNAHRALTGSTSIQNSYLVINNRYSVELLFSNSSELTDDLQRRYLDWLIYHPSGLRYLQEPLALPPKQNPSAIDHWLTSWEIILRTTKGIGFAEPLIEWLLAHQMNNGLWNLGSRRSNSEYFPLSDSWRKRDCQLFDWSTRILILLREYYDGID